MATGGTASRQDDRAFTGRAGKGLRAQINGYNVFNRSYANCQAGYCYRGAPATVIGCLIYRW